MKTKKAAAPALRGRRTLVLVRFSGVQAEALARLGRAFFGVGAPEGANRAGFIEAAALRVLSLALREPDRTVENWRAFLRYADAEGFKDAPLKAGLQDGQIAQAWDRSPAAKQVSARTVLD